MIEEERKVGPKGQVVIPKTFRKSMKIVSGSQVVFEVTDDGILIQKPTGKTEEVFKEVAEKGEKFQGEIHPHEAHDEELEERL